MEADKLYLNKLLCMASGRGVQAHVPKAVSERTGSQIHFSSELLSWDINLGRNQL